MGKRRTLLLLIPHLGGGGSERVTALLAWGLSPAKYDVHLGLVTRQLPHTEPLPPWVQVHTLNSHRVRTAALRLVHLVRRLQPDVVLSNAPHLNFLVLFLKPLFPPNTRILIRQPRTASARFLSGQWPDHSRLLYRVLYPRAERVICPTRALAQDLAAHAGIPSSRLDVLPNPVDVMTDSHLQSVPAKPWKGPGPHLLAVGRLSHEKGFDLLLHAFLTVRARYPDADLSILGDGPKESHLTSLAEALALQSCVRFPGRVPRPETWFADAHLFVLASRTEGLPNTLLEAAAAGLPLVATPCCDGVVNLLAEKPGAWLAQEIGADSLARCLLTALNSLEAGRQSWSPRRFSHPWIEEFRLGPAIARYEALLDQLPVGPAA